MYGAAISGKISVPASNIDDRVPYVVSTLRSNARSKLDITNVEIRKGEWKELCEALAENKSVSAVDLKATKMDSSAVGLLVDALLTRKGVIEKLDLSDNEITDEGCQALRRLLTSTRKLGMLSLAKNNISDLGGVEIMEGLRTNRMEQLDLQRNAIGDETMIIFGQLLENASGLKEVCVNYNQISNRCCQALKKGLEANPVLKSLKMRHNLISDDGGTILLEAFNVNTNLCEISLAKNKLSVSLLAKLQNAGSRNRKIKKGTIPAGAVKSKKKTEPSEMDKDMIDKFKKAYTDALKYGDAEPWGRCKLMILGEGRSGKTSTVRSLLGLAPNKNWDSTILAELKVANNWVETATNTSDFAYMAHKAAAHRLNEEAPPSYAGNFDDYVDEQTEPSEAPAKEEKRKSFTKRLSKGLRKSFSAGKRSSLARFVNPPIKPEPVDLVSEEEVAVRFDFDWVKEIMEEEKKDGEEKVKKISFTIWDYGGQQVFYTLHHIFLTTSGGIYLLVFDMAKVLSTESEQEETLETVRYWLNSIQLHAPNAPVILVGTRLDVVSSQEQHKKIERIFRDKLQVFSKHSKLVKNYQKKLSFFPLNNMSTNVKRAEFLRTVIEDEAYKLDYVHDCISLRWHKVLDQLLEDQTRPYYALKEVLEICSRYSITKESAEEMLEFFNEAGALVWLTSTPLLRGTVVTQPNWLIEKLGRVIRDELHVDELYYDPVLNERGLVTQFDRLRNDGIATRALLGYLWQDEEVGFLLDFMKNTMVLCDWKFGGKEEFLVSSLLQRRNMKNDGFESDALKDGLRCVLDFSEFFLPSGVFTRLVSICADYSGKQEHSIRPILQKSVAYMSFGWTEFLLEEDIPGNSIHIIFKPEPENEKEQHSNVPETIKTLVSMFKYLRDSVMGGGNLKWELVLSCPKNSGQLVSYDKLVTARKKNYEFIRSKSEQRVAVADFEVFFQNERVVGPLNLDSEGNVNGNELQGAVKKPLPSGFQYHCFISHKQSSGGDIAKLLCQLLTNRGYSVWFDQMVDNLTRSKMKEGIQKSCCFILLLTKDVFLSESVLFELTIAIESSLKIVLVHESDPGRLGYSDFHEYVKTQPSCLPESFFLENESLPYQRRYYLEKAFLEQLVSRINT